MDTPANGSSADAAATNASPPIVLSVKSPLEKLMDAVDKNPLDFNSWVSLLALVQSEASTPHETVEATFDRFLTEFPLCFGYWNKYAHYEYGLKSKPTEDGLEHVATSDEAKQRARDVYERGVVAVRYSVDMWIKYCEFVLHTLHSPVDEVRSLLERAVEACGADPMAGPLWELYIQLETLNNNMFRLNSVFKRMMHLPLRNLEEFWERYNQFVLAQQLSTLATLEEQKALAGRGEELMDEGLLRVKIVNAVEAVKNKTMEDIYQRQSFEAGIDRTYFHVTPVTEAAMKNWHCYLDFEEALGNEQRCQSLYERCLISCANYEEIWLRYATWMEKVRGFDAADAVFQRAMTIFLKYRASIFLEYALFLEAHDKLQKAHDTYMLVLSDKAPKLAEAFIKFCHFKRRRGEVEIAKTWFERGMKAVENEAQVYAYVVTSYATFLYKSIGDTASARNLFERALQTRSDSVFLWLNFIHFEMNSTYTGPVLMGVKNVEFVSRISRIYERALDDSCNLSMAEKNDLWFYYVEFLEIYGDSIAKVRDAREKEMNWKMKNSQPRHRAVKVLSFQSNWDNSSNGYNSNMDPGMKRPRYTAPQTSGAISTTPVTTASRAVGATVSTAASANYYQNYQGYGAQAQAYSQVDPSGATGQQAYVQAQYASYYQQ